MFFCVDVLNRCKHGTPRSKSRASAQTPTEPLGATATARLKTEIELIFSAELLEVGASGHLVSTDEHYGEICLFHSVCFWTIQMCVPSDSII